jgi:Ca2+-binding RTX toxin-like protein
MGAYYGRQSPRCEENQETFFGTAEAWEAHMPQRTLLMVVAVAALLAVPSLPLADEGRTCNGESASIIGTDGDDRFVWVPPAEIDQVERRGRGIYFTDGAVVAGLGGNDQVWANGWGSLDTMPRDLTVCGGGGHDKLQVYDGDGVFLSGGPGRDELKAHMARAVSLHGDAGRDVVNVSDSRRATLDGGSGSDGLLVQTGFDTSVYGGAGDDRIALDYMSSTRAFGNAGDDGIYTCDTRDVLLHGGAGPDRVGQCGDVFSSAKKLTIRGGSGNDRLYGSPVLKRSVIRGDAGDDRIWGKSRYGDTLRGGSGNDRIWGGEGRDRLFGDSGHDSLYGGPSRDLADGGRGIDTCRAEVRRRCER